MAKQPTNLILFLALATLVLVGFSFSQPKRSEFVWIEGETDYGVRFVFRKDLIVGFMEYDLDEQTGVQLPSEIYFQGAAPGHYPRNDSIEQFKKWMGIERTEIIE